MYHYFAGLDLGQTNDWTALAVLEEPVWIDEPPDLAPWAGAAYRDAVMWPSDRRGWDSSSGHGTMPATGPTGRRSTSGTWSGPGTART